MPLESGMRASPNGLHPPSCNAPSETGKHTSRPNTSSQSQSGKCLTSERSCRAPSSSQTSLLSSAVKGKSSTRMLAQAKPTSKRRARTSAQDGSVSSVPSKRSKVSNAKSTMVSAIAFTGMTGALNHATDCIQPFQDILAGSSTGTAPTVLPSPVIASSASAFRSTALANLNQDAALIPSKVRSKLAIEFISNEGFCQTYAELTDAQVRCEIATDWYKSKFGPVLPAVSPLSSSFTSPTSNFSQSSSGFSLPSSTFSPLASTFSAPVSAASSSTSPASSLFAGYDVGVTQYSCYLVDAYFGSTVGSSANTVANHCVTASNDDVSSNMDYSVYNDHEC
ncbi:hypothetical protein JVT61DRAFT_13645 [Boletus reticuloceps]|uniref:Uncharacterized protein n=1 Tax=Boletus reticuloceps TaxID=495285 RepID=A0A8I2YDA4_9AGAM|nr:hypothetical protein JVT61DRAFT_13645 [Boletus reticuloceps]